jgi:hypothetical protein
VRVVRGAVRVKKRDDRLGLSGVGGIQHRHHHGG